MLVESFPEMIFNTIHLHRWKKLAVWQMRYAVTVAADAYKLFYIGIPRGNIFVTYRPGDSNALLFVRIKVEITPPLRPPCPQQRLSSYLVSPDPIEWLHLC